MVPISVVLIIMILPLAVFLLRVLLNESMIRFIPPLSIAASTINLFLSGFVFFRILELKQTSYQVNWFSFGGIKLNAGIYLDILSASMLFVVWIVSFAVQAYSLSYMHGDRRLNDYYAFLSLFSFSMSGLVVSSSLLTIFVFWELVGLCSYLLIGFWYDRASASKAAAKAFIVTRLGDAAFFLGLVVLLLNFKTLDIIQIGHSFGRFSDAAVIAALLIFAGAIGKSAQFPLHVWLPDAMEGPTPVSALIHAATMVAAGIYVIARAQFLFEAPFVRSFILAVGVVTSIMSALIAVFQKDIKRTLAFSTISQLGYMMAGLGAGAFAYSIYHLYTHAFFKALLFLAAGSIFHAVHSLDITDAGGLFRKMKWTGILFLIGALNLAGFPLTSGFFSKDSILYGIKKTGFEWAYWLLVFGAFLTSFYIFKVFFRAFLGKPGKNFEEAHEADPKMLLPKVLLAVLSLLFIFPPFSDILKPAVSGHFEFAEALPGTFASLIGIALAYYTYGLRKFELEDLKSSFGHFVYDIFHNRLYIDEFYEAVFLGGYNLFSKASDWFDKNIVDGAVNGVAGLFKFTGKIIKPYETGQIQRYISFTLFVLLVIAALLVFLGGAFK